MSDAASRLTVKVKLHPAALPAETDTPAMQPAPWSKTRIALASLVLLGAGVAGYQFLLRPVTPAIAAVPKRTATEQSTVQPAAEQAIITTAPSITALSQPIGGTAGTPAASLSQPEVVAQSKPVAADTSGTAPLEPATQNIVLQPEQAASPSATPDKVTAATDTPESRPALPAGFSRIVLSDQMNNLQPGKAVGQQIPYPAHQPALSVY
ncbi:MAG: hypothetical protein U5L02_03660 [Rheinheimera sp.]|nr:hypothetical protein [Rheinheimera sp.]